MLQKCQPGESPVWRQRPPFTLRTTPLRFDDIRVPWKPTLDASLFKHVQLTRRTRLEIPVEAFNLTNTVIFAGPNTTFNDSNFGKIAERRGSGTSPATCSSAPSCHFEVSDVSDVSDTKSDYSALTEGLLLTSTRRPIRRSRTKVSGIMGIDA